MEKCIKDFVAIIEKSWKAPINVLNVDNSNEKYIKFKISTVNEDLNHCLLVSMTAMQKLQKIKYHSLTLGKNKDYIEVALSKKYTDFEANEVYYL